MIGRLFRFRDRAASSSDMPGASSYGGRYGIGTEWDAHVQATQARVIAALESRPNDAKARESLAAMRKVRDAQPCTGCTQVRAVVKSWADAVQRFYNPAPPAAGTIADRIRQQTGDSRRE